MRLDIGLKECAVSEVMLSRRDTGERLISPLHQLCDDIVGLLIDIQKNIWNQALERTKRQIKRIDTAEQWAELQTNPIDGMGYLLPWAGSDSDEAALNEMQWTIRCLLPYDHEWVKADARVKCVVSGVISDRWALVAKSY